LNTNYKTRNKTFFAFPQLKEYLGVFDQKELIENELKISGIICHKEARFFKKAYKAISTYIIFTITGIMNNNYSHDQKGIFRKLHCFLIIAFAF
jgi:hypothetical protein